jgi:hypothetical protein
MDLSLKIFDKPSLQIEVLLLELVSFIVDGPDPKNGQDDGRKENNKKENGEEFFVLKQD